MQKTLINTLALFILLVILQVVIFNNLVLFNSAIALVFLYLLVEMPIAISTNTMLFVGFLLGITIDIFQDTPGLNSMCCTIVAFARRPIFHLYVPRDEDVSERRLCIRTLGAPTYLKYMVTLVLIYCTLYFSIETFGFFDFGRLITRIIASTLFTFVVLYAMDSLTTGRREKRL